MAGSAALSEHTKDPDISNSVQSVRILTEQRRRDDTFRKNPGQRQRHLFWVQISTQPLTHHVTLDTELDKLPNNAPVSLSAQGR